MLRGHRAVELALVALVAACSSSAATDPDDSTCEPRTCEDEGWECGAASDWCGGTLDCGACSGRDVCGVDQPHVCTCLPTSCGADLAGCGTVDDGCGGALDCGGCAAPAACGVGDEGNACMVPGDLRDCSADGVCWENPYPTPLAPAAAFALAADDAWVVGAGGQIRRWDGATWRSVPASIPGDLRAVWAAAPDDGWAATSSSLVRWDGAAWTEVDIGPRGAFKALHGTAADDVWLVGDGVALRWDGAVWASATVADPPPLIGVFAADLDHAWAIDRHGVYEWSLDAWIPRTADPALELSGISGRSADDVVVVGTRPGSVADRQDDVGVVLRFDGATWSESVLPPPSQLAGVTAGPTRVVAFGAGGLTVLDGPALPPGAPSDIAAAALTPGDDLIVVDATGAPTRTAGGDWVADRVGPDGLLEPIGKVAGSVWFGDADRVWAWHAGGLVEAEVPPGPLLAIEGTSPTDVCAVVRQGADSGVVFHFDGTTWWSPADAPADVHALERRGDDLYAAGGAIFRRQGDAWAIAHQADGHFWRALDVGPAGALFAVGQRTDAAKDQFGVVTRLDNDGDVVESDVPGTSALCGVQASGPDDVWAAGWRQVNFVERSATISHFDGDAWTTEEVASGVACDIRIVAGDPVAIIDGQLWRRSGDEWQVWITNPGGHFAGLDVDGGGGLWLAGSGGAVLHQAPSP